MKWSIGVKLVCRFRLSFAVRWPWRSRRTSSPSPTAYELARFHIAGFQYHDGPGLLDELMTGLVLRMVREPENPHDRRAVAFRWGGSHLGYVPRDRNPTIARLLDQGAAIEGRILEISPDAEEEPWRAVRVAVFLLGEARSVEAKGSPFLADL